MSKAEYRASELHILMWDTDFYNGFIKGYEQAEKELLNRLEVIEREYKGMSHDAKSQENYIYASGLCEATARIIKLLKNDEEQAEWDGTEIAPPIDSDVCG